MAIQLLRLTIEVPAAQVDGATAAATAVGAQGIELLDADTGRVDGTVAVIAWLGAGVEPEWAQRTAAQRVGPDARITFERVEATWLAAVESSSDPQRIGRIWTAAPGVALDVPESEVLRIEAGMAFGAGAHPTTLICGDRLASVLESRVEADAVEHLLDVGAGTGVLAMVGLRLGVRQATVVEIDTGALESCRRNFRRNGLDATFCRELSAVHAAADLIVANLYHDVLLSLAEPIASRLRPGGRLLVSGFNVGLAAGVERTFEQAGLKVVDRAQIDGWVCSQFVAPAGA